MAEGVRATGCGERLRVGGAVGGGQGAGGRRHRQCGCGDGDGVGTAAGLAVAIGGGRGEGVGTDDGAGAGQRTARGQGDAVRQCTRGQGKGVRRGAAGCGERLAVSRTRGRVGQGGRVHCDRRRRHRDGVVLRDGERRAGAGGAGVGGGDGEAVATGRGRRTGHGIAGEAQIRRQRTGPRIGVRADAATGGEALRIRDVVWRGERGAGRRQRQGRAGDGQREGLADRVRTVTGRTVGGRYVEIEAARLRGRARDRHRVRGGAGDRYARRQVGDLIAAPGLRAAAPGEGLGVRHGHGGGEAAAGRDRDHRLADRDRDRGRHRGAAAVGRGVGEAVATCETGRRLVGDRGARGDGGAGGGRRRDGDRGRRATGDVERYRCGGGVVRHRQRAAVGDWRVVEHHDAVAAGRRAVWAGTGAAVGRGDGEVERAQRARRAGDGAGRGIEGQTARQCAGGDRIGIRRGAAGGRRDRGRVRRTQGATRQRGRRQHDGRRIHDQRVGTTAGERTRQAAAVGRGDREIEGAARGGRTTQNPARRERQTCRQCAGGDGESVRGRATARGERLAVGRRDGGVRDRRRVDRHWHVIVGDGADALVVGDGGVDRAAEVDEEGLVRLRHGLADHRHGDRLRGRARGEGQRAAGVGVIGWLRGGAVGGGVVDGHRLAAGGAEGDGEHGVDRAGIAFGHGDVVDRQRRRRVVVGDGAHALSVADHRVGHVGDVDEEGLVRLAERVAVHQHREGIRTVAGRDGLAGQAVGDVIHARAGGAVGGGDVEGDAAGACRCAQAHSKGEVGGAGIAFVDGDIVDGQRRQIVVEDGAGGAGRRADGVTGAGIEGEDHRLVGFDGGIGRRIDGDSAGGGAGGDGDRRRDGRVIGARCRGASDGEVHRDRDQRCLAQGDGVDQIGRTVLADAGRCDSDRGRQHVVVEDRASGTGRRADGVTAACGDREDHGLVGFEAGVGGRIDGDGRGGRARRDAHRGHTAGVIGAGRRGAAGGDVDHRRRRQIQAAGDGVDQVGGTVFADAGRGDRDRDAWGGYDGEAVVLQLEIAAQPGAGVGHPHLEVRGAQRGRSAAEHAGGGQADARR